jgi:LEA14-like dessication related protein
MLSPVGIETDPQPGRYFETVLEGPAPGAAGGEFRGMLGVGSSSSEIPIVGRAEAAKGRLIVRARLAYADVPRDWADRFQPDGFEYRIRGQVSGSEPISWSGRLSWNAVVVDGNDRSVSRFVRLTSFELTNLSERRTEGRAVLRVENPFSFPVRVGAASYEVSAGGRVIGRGKAKERVLRPKRVNVLEVPFSLDHAAFLAAAGTDFAVGREVEAGLRGSFVLRFASGDLSVPVRLEGNLSTDGARSGVFAPPPGSADLSPRP